MSAICGAISLSGKEIPKKYVQILKDAFSGCVIDRWEEVETSEVYMRCGIQYFTEEAKGEQLPYRQGDIWFNADVVLDNRQQICELLQSKGKIAEPIGRMADGELLRLGVEEYGYEGLRNLLGAYAFVRYDSREKKIVLSSDAVGGRYIYYLVQDEIVYYASLMTPLEKIIHKIEINERWVADFIGQDNLNMYTESEENPILGIYRTPPSHYVEITLMGKKVVKYWDPMKSCGKIKLKNDEEYRREFLKLFSNCVNETLRANGETGILLSGGYDSTAVAVMAAKTLKNRGKKLYSFTSVPFQGYQSEFGESLMTDETEAVRKTQEFIGNLDCTFMDMPKMDGWTWRKQYLGVAEIPYKSPQNMLWMYEGYQRAREKNVRILLGGMFGNGTISYSNTQQYMVWLFRHMKFRTLLREADGIKKRQHYTKKSVLLTTAKQALGVKKAPKMKREDLLRGFAKKDYLDKQGAIKRILRRENKVLAGMMNAKKYHLAFIPTETMRHYGEFAQKNSLYTGVLVRDPSRDPRMIEFTMHIPENQFTHDGYVRRLIADYMKELMPPHILCERRSGRQSADLKARILRIERLVKGDWECNYEKFMNNSRIDCQKALKDLKKRTMSEMTDFEIVRHIFTNILLEYLDEKE